GVAWLLRYLATHAQHIVDPKLGPYPFLVLAEGRELVFVGARPWVELAVVLPMLGHGSSTAVGG
ncbi:hypothetical protein Dimus_036065, partial [Dionaea muscipula]